MKKFVTTVFAAGLVGAVVTAAQPPILTYPAVPAREALDRLNLRVAWRVSVPLVGVKDGIATVQNLGDVVIVQSRRGTVTAIDPISGAVRWMTNVGEPYPVVHAVGFNDHLILVDNGTRVHALDRANGSQLWEVNLPSTPSSPPSADDNAFYVHLGVGRLAAYAFPGAPSPNAGPRPPGASALKMETAVSRNAKAAPAQGSSSGGARYVRFSGAIASTRTTTVSAQVIAGGGSSGGRSATSGSEINKTTRGVDVANAPQVLWFYQTNLQVHERPVVSDQIVMVVSNDRTALYIDKTTGAHPTTFTANSPFTAPAAKFGESAYLGSRDGGVYAIDMSARVARWSYTANNSVINAAVATDADVFIAADHGGLIRLERSNGRLHWQNTAAQHFLATNPKFVYAMDPQGRLLVLDRLRGTTLTTLETRGYGVLAVNRITDRLFLAANDGTILCLHDKAYAQPVHVQNQIPVARPPDDAPKVSGR